MWTQIRAKSWRLRELIARPSLLFVFLSFVSELGFCVCASVLRSARYEYSGAAALWVWAGSKTGAEEAALGFAFAEEYARKVRWYG